MASAALAPSHRPIPHWVRRRFVRKHSGLSDALVLAIPASAALWIGVAYAIGAL